MVFISPFQKERFSTCVAEKRDLFKTTCMDGLMRDGEKRLWARGREEEEETKN